MTNEQIDAFNRGERDFINEQLALLTLKQKDIWQEMEKASLELVEDEDYRSRREAMGVVGCGIWWEGCGI